MTRMATVCASAITSNVERDTALERLGIDRSRTSPNHGSRAPGCAIDMVLLHYTGMRDGSSAIEWLCNPVSQVSSHYVVEEDGTILQLVPDERRAWHAGRSSWAGETDINSVSIGIEIVNGGHDYDLPAFPQPQIEAVTRLCRALTLRYRIAPERVLAHSDVAPARKRDPGERFPWAQLAAAGVGHWVEAWPTAPGPIPALQNVPNIRAVQHALAAYGYGVDCTGCDDEATETVVRAFQRHFRPMRVDGRADAALLRLLTDLTRTRRSGRRG